MNHRKSNWRRAVLAVVASVLIVALSLLGVLRARSPAEADVSSTAPAPVSVQRDTLRAGPGAIGQGGGPGDPATAQPAATNTTQPATATAQPAPNNDASQPIKETRGLWVTRFDGLKTPADVQTLVDNAAYAHINVIYFQVRGQADAMYTPGLEPWSASLSSTLGQDPGWDPLAVLIQDAHAKGIEVHAWINTYTVWQGSTPPPASANPKPMYVDFNEQYGQNWVMWDQNGPMQLGGPDGYLWANPAFPAVQDHIVAVCTDLLTRYQLDGLHMDYIRYAGAQYSQDPVSNQEYAAAHAANPNLTRADWQRDQVTTLVQRIRDEALPARPGAVLTTTAWPVYKDQWGWYNGKDGYNALYQDSEGWTNQNLVSAINPMLYGPTVHDHMDRFQTLVQDYVSGSRPGSVVVGIGGDYSSFSDISARIDVARQAGASGEAFFSYQALNQNNYWSDLRNGPYQQPAVPSWR